MAGRREPGVCPICGVPVPPRPPAPRSDFPFCSERCRMVDLGRWLTGGYAIPGEPVPGQPDPAPEAD